MGRLLLLFVVVPAVELALLIKVGGMIGVLPTLALIVITGVAGANLARSQGMAVWLKAQQELNAGRVPTRALLEGCLILVAGAVLLTPGFLTDAFGLLCLIPFTRGALLDAAERALQRAQREGRVQVHFHGRGGGPGGGPGAHSGRHPGAAPRSVEGTPIRDVEAEVRGPEEVESNS